MSTEVITTNQTIALLRTEQERLAAELASLPEESWSRPSPCAGWTLATVVAHLAVQARLLGGVVRMARDQQPGPPPPLTAATRAEYYVQRDALIMQEAARKPAEIQEAFARSGLEFVELVESLREADLDKPSYVWGGGTRPTRGAIPLRLFELAIHDWDIRRSLGPDARIPTDLDRFIVGHVRTSALNTYKGTGDAGPVRVELTEPVPTTWLLSVRDGKLTISDADGTSALATIQADPQTFVLLGVGRLKAGETVPGGVLAITGDASAAQQVLAGFTGF